MPKGFVDSRPCPRKNSSVQILWHKHPRAEQQAIAFAIEIRFVGFMSLKQNTYTENAID
jgi:hypothetical protein